MSSPCNSINNGAVPAAAPTSGRKMLSAEHRSLVELTPLAGYLDYTVAQLLSEVGGAVDALGLKGKPCRLIICPPSS